MKNGILASSLLLFTVTGWAVDYKVFWRCSDNHLEAMDVYEKNDKKSHILLNYIKEENNKEVLSSPISVKSLVDLPSNFNHDNFLMLGNDSHVFMNCVGQVNINPHDIHGKVVFDVRKNAHGCPLIPKDCQ
ncbi:hypothetical protein [Legionella cardiaca]|uniref:DUF4124 domain-containing protein n=1 Tax=Legionella cardiaca TaxID=1071983 RepID=A0ABY8ATG6_9GAMM|nr:hypothetical protein [Legionella cardiaca]WED43970.1 hypothetical protein PXX05_04075 [Legionella cardiaca]